MLQPRATDSCGPVKPERTIRNSVRTSLAIRLGSNDRSLMLENLLTRHKPAYIDGNIVAHQQSSGQAHYFGR